MYFKNQLLLNSADISLCPCAAGLKGFILHLIAIQSVMAFGGETVGQRIDKLSKYWWDFLPQIEMNTKYFDKPETKQAVSRILF